MQSFEEIGLNPNILKALEEKGFVEPTPIQDKTIKHLINSDRDLIGLAQTGTGKTAAFGLPILEQIEDRGGVQAIILCPTRELCMQISNDIESFSKYMDKVKVTAVYGGASIEPQIKQIRAGSQIIVGTPGRTNDLIRRKILKISNIKWFVLDEADEMLSMGFKEDINTIFAETPEEKQTLLFSATMPREIKGMVNKFMNNPEEIVAGERNIGSTTVNHIYYMVSARDRYLALKRIVDVNTNIYGIIFCRTRRETKEIAESLLNDGYDVDALHGDLSQAQRDYVMGRFRNKSLQILVATDVAARGIDVTDLTHIINYNLPDELEAYIHRSGRTGRAGKKGTSIVIIHSKEKQKIRLLEKKVGKPFEYQKVPNGVEICEKQLYKLVDKVEKIEVDDEQIEQYMPAIYKKLESLSREDLIKHFVSAEFSRFLEYYKNAPDININPKIKNETKGSGRADYTRFFLSVGASADLKPAILIGLVNDATNKKDIDIGAIEIMNKFSFFEVEKIHEDLILSAFENMKYNGKSVSVEIANSKGSSERRSGGGGGNRRSYAKSDRGNSPRGGRDRRSGGSDSRSNSGNRRSRSTSSGDRRSGGSPKNKGNRTSRRY